MAVPQIHQLHAYHLLQNFLLGPTTAGMPMQEQHLLDVLSADCMRLRPMQLLHSGLPVRQQAVDVAVGIQRHAAQWHSGGRSACCSQWLL